MSDFRVLLPLDGSRIAEHSLMYLDALRALGNLQGELVSIVDDSEEPHNMTPVESDERESNLLSTYLREVSGDLEKHLGLKFETKVLRGAPATRLLDETRAYAPDLLIISTHGRSAALRWRFGSIADKLIRGAECNTLVVGPKATEREVWLEGELIPPFKSILLPVDGSALSTQAVDVAQRLAQAFGSTVHVVQVVGIPTASEGFAVGATYVPDLLDLVVEGAKANLEEVAKHLAGSDVKTEVLIGSASADLENYVRRHDIDLVVMTTHGRGGIVRTALGSVTDRMLASSSAPVLVVRPQEHAS